MKIYKLTGLRQNERFDRPGVALINMTSDLEAAGHKPKVEEQEPSTIRALGLTMEMMFRELSWELGLVKGAKP